MEETTGAQDQQQQEENENEVRQENSAAKETTEEKQIIGRNKKKKKKRIAFIHLDLGIGGAESLILHLATASLDYCDRDKITIYTTRCDQDHCYDAFNTQKKGVLSESVCVVGRFIPASFCGYCQALFSNLRYLYVTLYIIFVFQYYHRWRLLPAPRPVPPDIIVVDVLPLPIPLLQFFLEKTSVLFYCHFPDKLLIRQQSSGADTSAAKGFYRKLMDQLEDFTIQFADLLVANSEFTKQKIQQVFPSLLPSPSSPESNNNRDTINKKNNDIHILYPTLDISEEKEPKEQQQHKKQITPYMYIVSLNRYERKKNIELLLYAYQQYLNRLPPTSEEQKGDVLSRDNMRSKVKLIIAGGYDTQVTENVEYRKELQQLCETKLQLKVKNVIDESNDWDVKFLMNISDQERSILLERAICLVYTPHEEHFGIVPLEAMYLETCVIACDSGGPTETILHEQTGYLCSNKSSSITSTTAAGDDNTGNNKHYIHNFSIALEEVINDPLHAFEMGKKGKQHVLCHFSKAKFKAEWEQLLNLTIQNGNQRQQEVRKSLWRKLVFVTYELLCFTVVGMIVYEKYCKAHEMKHRHYNNDYRHHQNAHSLPPVDKEL